MSNQTRNIAYAIVDEIDTDVQYVRSRKERLYLTGAEVALWLATMVFASFCIGLVKGLKEGAEKAGEQLGIKTIEAIVNHLSGIRDRLSKVDTENTKQMSEQVRASQDELDQSMNEIPKLPAKRAMVITHDFEIDEIRSTLIDNGFPVEKATVLSERLVTTIKERWRVEEN